MSPRRRRAFEWTLAAAVLAGALLRFVRSGEPLWLDEALVWRLSRLSPGEILRLLPGSSESNPPGFYLLVHSWMRAFGDSDLALHFLTALIGVAGIGAAYWAGKRTLGRFGGLAAATLLALHPLHLAYSQELRPYGLLVLFGFVMIGGCLEALRSGRGRDWALFAGASIAALYVHYYAAFLILAAALAAWSRPVPSGARIAFPAVLVGALPLAPLAFRQARDLASRSPYPLASAEGAVRALYSLAGVQLRIGAADARWTYGKPLVAAAAVLAAALLLRRLMKEERVLLRRLAFFAIVAAAVPFVLSLHLRVYLPGRHSIVALPALCLLLAAGLKHASAKTAALSLGVLALVFGVTGARYFAARKSFDKEIAEYLSAPERKDLRVLAPGAGWMLIPVGRYYPKAASPFPGAPRPDPRTADEETLILRSPLSPGPDCAATQAKRFGDYAVVERCRKT
ncbi:MAG: glycosyltransferase family 39 protein [Elusimicrobia bacterium]|nr:glycosyltransferase family 39 protein [Elusimicrobiota bacterium]